MTTKSYRKRLARELQDEMAITYSAALTVIDTGKPPPGWVVARSELDIADERLRRAITQAQTSPTDPTAQLLAAFAALRVLEPYAWAPRCDREVAGADPHSGDWTTVRCDQPQHPGACAPDGVLEFLWRNPDMGPAREP